MPVMGYERCLFTIGMGVRQIGPELLWGPERCTTITWNGKGAVGPLKFYQVPAGIPKHPNFVIFIRNSDQALAVLRLRQTQILSKFRIRPSKTAFFIILFAFPMLRAFFMSTSILGTVIYNGRR